ncbi:MAG: hypothetical protein J5966_05275, partial [Lachnospiraceae bacterium]|nr:hypothetical protein [Lachnospiraceae bacterium]
MKKILKGLLGIAVIGGIAAGVYYFLTGDKYTEFDDFDEESNDDLQDFLDKERESDEEDLYVSLDLTGEKASGDDRIIGEVKDEEDKVVKAD